jgi:hypothetical protein
VIGLLLVLLLCPVQGRATSPWERHQNSLKNRTGTPTQFVLLTVDELVAAGPEAFADYAAAEVDGWVVGFKREGPESCNCFDKHRVDLHLEIATEKGGRRSMVVEVTPRRPVANATFTLIGRRVSVRGWLFYDAHHVHQPGRATAWEIHPVTSIRVLE